MEELLEYLETNYANKQPTLKQYKNHFRRLQIINPDLNNYTECIDCLKDLDNSLSQKLGLLNLIIIYTSRIKNVDMDKDTHPLFIFRNELKNEELLKKVSKNEILKTQLPDRDTLHKFMNNEFKKSNFKNYIVNYLLLNFNVRNADCNVRIFKNQDPCVDDINYMVFYNDTPDFVVYKRNKYKTSNIYGKQEHKIMAKGVAGKNLCNAVREIYDINDGKNNEGVPLFKTTNGLQVSDTNCGWYVANSTYQGIGEGKYLKIILNDINNKPNTMNILNRISASRGTGAKHLITDYNISQSVNDILQ